MIIVDGYNVIYKWKSLSKYVYNMELARTRLADMLANYQGFVGGEIVIVFDSCKKIVDAVSPQNIQVIYSSDSQGADMFIENMVSSSKTPEDITVVTGDILERSAVSKSGAGTMSPERFEEEVQRETIRRHHQ